MRKITLFAFTALVIGYGTPASATHDTPAVKECLTVSQMFERNKPVISRELRFAPEIQKVLVDLVGMAGRADYILFAFLKNGTYGYAGFVKGCYVTGSANVMDQKTFLYIMSLAGNPDPLAPDKDS